MGKELVKIINTKTKNSCWLSYCLICVTCVILFFLPSFRKGLMMGWDSPFHMARIESLYRALRSGVFPAKVRPCLNYTYGYGVGFFYPDLFLYFPDILMLGTCLQKLFIFGAIDSVAINFFMCKKADRKQFSWYYFGNFIAICSSFHV